MDKHDMPCHCAAAQVLDVIGTVTPSYADLKEVSLFLTAPNVLPPEMALALYVSIGARGGWPRLPVGIIHPVGLRVTRLHLPSA